MNWKTLIKDIGIITGLIATAWGAFELVDTMRDNHADTTEELQEIKRAVDHTNSRVDSLYIISEQRDDSEQEIKEMISNTENRLLYYISHEQDMTNEQILDAFELGFETGKKKELTACGTP